MNVSALVAAAGLGLRLQSSVAKPLCLINDRPLIVLTLERLSTHPLIDKIVVVASAADRAEMQQLIYDNDIKKISGVIEGGSTRTQSVTNGLKHIGLCDFVLVHDGARPFVSHQIISDAIESARKNDAVVVGIPLSSTIKKVTLKTHEVECTLRREEMWQIQTPQVFRKDIIVSAYENADGIDACDDAFLVERLKHRVVVVMGSTLNIKITTPEDLILAQAIDTLTKGAGVCPGSQK